MTQAEFDSKHAELDNIRRDLEKHRDTSQPELANHAG